MIKTAFDKGWICYRTDQPEQKRTVSIPHDAMLLDERSNTSPGGVNTGWYEAKDYTYENTLFIPEDWKDEILFLEFEGVYHKATVFINGKKAAYQEYGYIGFYIPLNEWIEYGTDNRIQVSVINHDQPNSRWYSGTGIYRPVWLYRFPKQHITPESIRITTLSYQKPEIRIQAKLHPLNLQKEQEVLVEILNHDTVVKSQLWKEKSDILDLKLSLDHASLWDSEHPHLYQCRLSYGSDTQTETFGIRMITCDPEKGFQINGNRVILRGACVHHDNGFLGACAYDFAEYRKIRLIKEAGYNAIRSAHNPCSKTLLRACDELGIYVMDEYVDYWYIHKTKYDYADHVISNYNKDLKAMVAKDYNHPSVVMYSTGNEVAESGQKKGIELCRRMTEVLHRYDSTRYVTCGINIFFNFLSSMGFGVYSDKKADQAAKDVKKKKAVGSEFFNILAGIAGADFMKTGATLYPCDLKTKDSFAAMDIAGYNYGIKRYEHDLKKYPKRIIVGSETFCADAFKFWETAKKNTRLIGDFVWAGIDYLGEVGIGAWEYKEYAPDFSHGNGWLTAGSGRLDITGKELGEMQYTKVAFEQKEIAMAVVPVHTAKEKHSPSAWKMSNAMESWSYSGCEGMETTVEVYARAAFVGLFLNGKLLAEKPVKTDCKVEFTVKYEDGTLTAVSYDQKKQEIARTSLTTAGKDNQLTLIPEITTANLKEDLCYVRMQYTDKNGVVKPMLRGKIQVTAENGEILGIGSASPYYPMGYHGSEADTYYGEAMVILKPTENGILRINASSPYGNACCEIEVIG